jgi:excinuclease ABC subunit C
LEHIEGIGAKSLNALLKRFKTVSNVRSASVEKLAEVVGLKRAQNIVKYFTPNT